MQAASCAGPHNAFAPSRHEASPGGMPVRNERALRLGEPQPAGTYRLMEDALQMVLRLAPHPSGGRLGCGQRFRSAVGAATIW